MYRSHLNFMNKYGHLLPFCLLSPFTYRNVYDEECNNIIKKPFAHLLPQLAMKGLKKSKINYTATPPMQTTLKQNVFLDILNKQVKSTTSTSVQSFCCVCVYPRILRCKFYKRSVTIMCRL